MAKPASPPPMVQMTNPHIQPGEPVLTDPNQSAVTEQRDDNVFCCSTPLDVLVPCNRCFIVPERLHMVELFFGHYHGTITKPGCYCRSTLGVELRPIGTNLITHDLPNAKVLDVTGSPIIVSGIVTYEIVNARRAAIDVEDPHRFIKDKSPAVLKRIVSQFPYESPDSSLPCLLTETELVSSRMRDALQQQVAVSGVRIDSFNINELSYAPEIAQAMLRRQQADAVIAARRAIVRGAREIAHDAIQNLPADVSSEQRAHLFSNLLIVLAGDKEVTPTLSV